MTFKTLRVHSQRILLQSAAGFPLPQQTSSVLDFLTVVPVGHPVLVVFVFITCKAKKGIYMRLLCYQGNFYQYYLVLASTIYKKSNSRTKTLGQP